MLPAEISPCATLFPTSSQYKSALKTRLHVNIMVDPVRVVPGAGVMICANPELQPEDLGSAWTAQHRTSAVFQFLVTRGRGGGLQAEDLSFVRPFTPF